MLEMAMQEMVMPEVGMEVPAVMGIPEIHRHCAHSQIREIEFLANVEGNERFRNSIVGSQ